MVKRVFSMFMVLVLLLLTFTGCSKATNSSNIGKIDTNNDIDQNENVKKVAFVTSQRLGDEGPVDMVFRGVNLACEEANLQLHVVEAQKGEYEESMQAMISEGYSLIVALFPELLDSVKNVASQNPDTDFIHTICLTTGDNIQGIVCYEQKSSFVMGALAALMTKTNKIAYGGAVDNPDQNRYLDGFKEGVNYINPNIEVQVSWIGSFEDPAKGKELALVHYQDGCDVLWGCGGKSGLGAYEAVKEMGEGYYVMATTDDNNSRLPEQVLASHMEYYDVATKEAVLDWSNGNYKPGLTMMTLDNGYAYPLLADESQCHIPTEVRNEIEDIITKLESGEIVVKSMPTYEEVLSTITD